MLVETQLARCYSALHVLQLRELSWGLLYRRKILLKIYGASTPKLYTNLVVEQCTRMYTGRQALLKIVKDRANHVLIWLFCFLP